MKLVTNVFFIVLASDTDGAQLKKTFREEFQTRNQFVEVTLLNREECVDYFDIEDSRNEIEMIHSIISKVPPHSLVFFDEAPMKTDNEQTGRHYDWSMLVNDRRESVFLLISFKPVVPMSTRSYISVDIKWPAGAEVVTLTRSYRQSVSLFHTLQTYHSQGVRVLNAEVKPVDVVQGPKPEVLFFYDGEVNDCMKTFILFKLESSQYSPGEVKILFTKNKSEDAHKIFASSKYCKSLTELTSFIGCEAPVVIMFFSEDDKNWQFLEMASRAQYKVKLNY